MLDDNTSYDEFIRQTIREQSREEVLRRVKKTIWVTFQKEGIHKYPFYIQEMARRIIC